MKDETLSLLNDFLNGNNHTLTKCDDEEISGIVLQLEAYKILTRNSKGSFCLNGFENIKNLEKLIELQNFTNFKIWLSETSVNSFPTFNITNSNLGQINNHSNVKGSNISIDNEKVESTKKKESVFFKFWNLISENKLISGLILAIIFFIIKEYLGINIK